MEVKRTLIECHDVQCCNNSKKKCLANEIKIGSNGRCKSYADIRGVMFNNGIDLSSQ